VFKIVTFSVKKAKEKGLLCKPHKLEKKMFAGAGETKLLEKVRRHLCRFVVVVVVSDIHVRKCLLNQTSLLLYIQLFTKLILEPFS